MQTANVNLPIVVTGRHVNVTEAMRDYAKKKIEGLHLDYPKIIEAKVVLDVPHGPGGPRHFAEIVLFCANHITIECSSESADIYASIDETISKIARRMRKFKTRLLKSHRPRSNATIRHLDEHVYTPEHHESESEQHDEMEPVLIHKENYRVKPLYPDEAITDLEMSDRSFVVFTNQKNHQLSILFRRKDGDYGVMEISQNGVNGTDHA